VVCPECEAVTRTPFVRVGARARCGSCGARYVVDGSRVRRHAPPASAVVVVKPKAEDPAAGTDDPTRPDDTHDPAAAGDTGGEAGDAAGGPGDAPLGLTGLSDLLCREAGVPPGGPLGGGPPPTATAAAPTPPTPQPPAVVEGPVPEPSTAARSSSRRPRARRQRDTRRRLLLGGAATLLLATAVLGVVLWASACRG